MTQAAAASLETSAMENDRADGDRARAEDAFASCLDRLEALLDSESEALRACAPMDFEPFNLRKAHILLECTRLSRALPRLGSGAIGRHLARVNDKLSENARLLDLHLKAIREIARIMIFSIQQEESDGTYSSRPRFKSER